MKRHAQDAVRAAQPRLQGVRAEQDARDLAEAEGDDGEVVAAQPEHRRADEEANDRRERDHEREGDPEVEAPAERGGRRRDQGGEVRADGVEGDIAQVEQAGVADHDVEAQAQQDVEADQHEDLRQEGPGDRR